jgi:hypothetical protein
MTVSETASSPSAVVTAYDSHDLYEYATKWDQPMGPGEPAVAESRTVSHDGVISIAAVPFTTGVDAVFDHAKYFAVSHEQFSMPKSGSLEFSVDMAAATPGTEPGRVIHGTYTDSSLGQRVYAHPTLEGQQAALMFNVSNMETNQLFDWFVSGSSVFVLIERLPSAATNPSLRVGSEGYVGLDKAYTQIVRSAPVSPGDTHSYAIRYTRNENQSSVEYLLDGDLSPAWITSGSRSTRGAKRSPKRIPVTRTRPARNSRTT